MADQNPTPEVIERQIQDTRESLTDKVAQLEQTVVGTLQTATEAVQDTVTTVKSAVEDSVEAVKDSVQESVTSVTDSVKETLNLSQHMRDYPWPMLGGAFFGGLAVGWMFLGRRQVASAPVASPLAQPRSTPEASSPGMMDAVMGTLGTEIKRLAETAMSTGFAALRHEVQEKLPEFLAETLQPLVEKTEPATDTAQQWPPQSFRTNQLHPTKA